jgi:hypothetical protein
MDCLSAHLIALFLALTYHRDLKVLFIEEVAGARSRVRVLRRLFFYS